MVHSFYRKLLGGQGQSLDRLQATQLVWRSYICQRSKLGQATGNSARLEELYMSKVKAWTSYGQLSSSGGAIYVKGQSLDKLRATQLVWRSYICQRSKLGQATGNSARLEELYMSKVKAWTSYGQLSSSGGAIYVKGQSLDKLRATQLVWRSYICQRSKLGQATDNSARLEELYMSKVKAWTSYGQLSSSGGAIYVKGQSLDKLRATQLVWRSYIVL